eukprot:gnl/MRDRNA2_/MRDRNA2_94980_c0_seq1.p1 gnl/MRDRNA2_/MRDRNA2_94980_c0~~gnl/MRDRNA2_/MRDRNA2_94980_c0_seq1.p1  ORF type:complete len:176 (+),score=56.36 gnl/MRDRNA2_/MRDRNA2_94980_c0_seq1:71-598(+)
MRAQVLLLAFAALAQADDAPKYDEPELHAYPDAAKDLKNLMESVKKQTENVTFGKRHDSAALKTMSTLESRTHLGAARLLGPRKSAKLGMASVDTLTVDSASIKDQRAQSWMEGLKAWKKAGKQAAKALPEPAQKVQDEDLELPDDDEEQTALQAKWKAVDALRKNHPGAVDPVF